jgi:DNA primase
METLALEQDLSDPKVKQVIAGQVLPLIEDVPSMVERDAYRQRLARLLRVDEDSLGGRQGSASKTSRSRWNRQSSGGEHNLSASASRSSAATVRNDPRALIEDHLIAVLIKQPDVLHRLDRMLQQANLSRLSDADIHQTDRLILFQLVGQSLTQSDLNSEEYIVENRPEETADVYAKLAQQSLQENIKPEALCDDLFRSVLRMRLITINQTLNELRFLLEENQDGEQNNQYQSEVLLYTQQIQRINLAMGSLTRLKT